MIPIDAIDPPAFVVQIDSRRSEERRERERREAAALTIGAIILLSDGTQCQIVDIDQNGTPWCIPLQEPQQ